MKRGFSLVEVVIVSAVMLLFFGGLFQTIQTSLKLITDSRARLSALSVANNYMEYIRSFSYDSLGTVSGIPSGTIPQVSTTSLNGIIFTRTALVEYIDDAGDGLDGADSNSITTDYKRAKVEVSWFADSATNTIYLITNFAPPSIETNVGGGTIRVNVFDSHIAALPGASVRLLNTTGTSTIDVTKSSDSTGVALFGGAPANSNYQIFVTGTGYSTDQTYQATTSNPNPAKLPVAVTASGITTSNFFIDRLGGLSLRVLTDRDTDKTVVGFATTTDVATSTYTEVVSDELRLAHVLGVYSNTGDAYVPLTPTSSLMSWQRIKASSTLPSGTAYRLRLYTGTTSPVIIPDSDLPGNSVGFTGTIDISTLATTTYPDIVVRVTLTTTDTAVTPRVLSLEARYVSSETVLGSATYTLTGSKTIGTYADASPVYKTLLTKTTDSGGQSVVPNLEWDSYTADFSGYDVEEACTEHPIGIAPGATTTSTLILNTNSANTLRVVVLTAGGAPIEDATVSLHRGFTSTKTTSVCGQVFYSGLASESDYELTVSAPGYTTVTVDPLDISGDEIQTITL